MRRQRLRRRQAMTKTDLDRQILEAIAADPGLTVSSVTKLLKECASDEAIRQHIYRLAARRYLRLGEVAALYPLIKGIAAIKKE